MKYTSDDRGIIPVLVVILVAVLVVAAGVAVYNVSKSHQKAAQTTTTSSSPDSSATPASTASPTPSPSDQDLITTVVKSDIAARGATPLHGSEVILRKLQSPYARVDINVAQGSGYFYLLKKNQITWSIAFMGQNIDPNKEVQLGFPQDFDNTAPFQSVVLYTY